MGKYVDGLTGKEWTLLIAKTISGIDFNANVATMDLTRI